MPDPDSNAEPESATDPRFDDWPVRRYDAAADLTVERATPDDDGRQLDDVEWVGGTRAGSGGAAYVYAPESETLHRGRYDHENDRVVVDDETAVERETLGDHLVDVGEDHGWGWLSSFAREHMDTPDHDPDDPTAEHLLPPGFDHEATAFQRRNLVDDADEDAAFFGSHTFADDTDRVHVLEREFAVTAAASDDRADVHVEERYLVAEEPREEDRAGDADVVEEREYDLALDVDRDERWIHDAEGLLTEWHRRHLAPPEREEHRRVERGTAPPDDSADRRGV
ncbi:hypothetical protein HZS55_18050 [Halosimplex rubrum]|uniref:Uncharacterized protein n=1 Tax=Halosimplex rubrum TaxID=869889 RepID=A0A7D5P4Q3_9EURY|nr:hypothetical protein [Halosimplex rubrum]QLH79081.1 hypothetical protein HZS55_18050 [Halosimplex rubrum]